ncbi:uncharacterized protein LOC122210215 isoform X1 [Panthera leo]|uniref:uncharacterized protein LOC122210215 isoform X1 n=1 Tax=Panthera leo TaxID=9689 RepID=UPI001C6A0ED6|nr:uncharacterized protein LOC122210215 isoform X1 [Panthera leo]
MPAASCAGERGAKGCHWPKSVCSPTDVSWAPATLPGGESARPHSCAPRADSPDWVRQSAQQQGLSEGPASRAAGLLWPPPSSLAGRTPSSTGASDPLSWWAPAPGKFILCLAGTSDPRVREQARLPTRAQPLWILRISLPPPPFSLQSVLSGPRCQMATQKLQKLFCPCPVCVLALVPQEQTWNKDSGAGGDWGDAPADADSEGVKSPDCLGFSDHGLGSFPGTRGKAAMPVCPGAARGGG